MILILEVSMACKMDKGFYGHMKVSVPKMKAVKAKKKTQKLLK